MCLPILSLAKCAIIIAVSAFVIGYWLDNKNYVFDNARIAKIAKKHAGGDPETAFNNIAADLRKAYPANVLPECDWILATLGGCTIRICMLHLSATEYLGFHGSALGTECHTGRHWVNVSMTVIAGEFEKQSETEFTSSRYRPGDTFDQILSGTAAVQRYYPNTWVMEYSRGFVLTSSFHTFGGTIFITQDIYSIYHFLVVSFRSKSQQMGWAFSGLKDRIQAML